jgi:hypothetical protein
VNSKFSSIHEITKSTKHHCFFENEKLIMYPEDGGCIFLRNTDKDLPEYMALHPRR